MPSIDFADIDVPIPAAEDVVARQRAIESAFDSAGDAEGRLAALRRWDDLRKELGTAGSLVHLRFSQDTRDEERQRARKTWDALSPKLQELETGFQRRLIAGPHRAELEARLGKQAFALWESQVTTYDPAIEKEVVEEAELSSQYTQLLASARIEFQGETWNLSGMRKFLEHRDRAVRRDAVAQTWAWLAGNGEELDRIFAELVTVRHRMARTLGFEDHVGMGYRRACRIDYDRGDVERYRAAVREHVVPLCVELRRRQAGALGLEQIKYWDESVLDARENPAPKGDHDWMIARAIEMFDAMGSGLGEFFHLMVDGRLMDLKMREGKAGGGFCTSFPTHGVPFIYANFNGTKGDVQVFTHEMGHAFQGYRSRSKFPIDYLWPTAESCEIHSMGLEFLTYPHMERFFGDDAERFRRFHTEGALTFLPYGVAVDHFQHLVYEQPDATPAERHAMWREMERTYLPWRDYGGIERLEQGGFWQMQLHIYNIPFYYIDYTLAQVCALQFRARAERDPAEALDAYVALCGRGGEAPFQELVRSAGLESPFHEGCLESVVGAARGWLGL